jgi:hypothetical protein
MVDAGSLKHELLNRLRSIKAANVLRLNCVDVGLNFYVQC